MISGHKIHQPGFGTSKNANNSLKEEDDRVNDVSSILNQVQKQDDKKNQKSSNAQKTIALTFDDGPIKGATEEVISALGDTPATFFLTGENLAHDPGEQKRLVELELSKGHQIANHTYSHIPFQSAQYKEFGDLTDSKKKKLFLENFKGNEEHFKKLLKGKETGFKGFEMARLPGDGKNMKDKSGHNVFIDALQKDLGLVHVGWDFEFAPNNKFKRRKFYNNWQQVDGVAAEDKNLPNDKAIVLMHDAHWKGQGGILKNLISFLKKHFKIGKLDKNGKVS